MSSLQASPLAGFLDKMSGVSSAPLEIKNQFTNSFIPFYFSDQALLIEKSSSEAIITIDCVEEVAAEYAMSAFSGRKAHVAYRGDATTRNGELYVSAGKQALTTMPESGIGNIELDQLAIAEELKRRKALTDVIHSASLEEKLAARLAPYLLGQAKEKRTKAVNNILERDDLRGIHYYMLVKIDKDTDLGKQALVKVEAYKKMFPKLFFINLASELDDRELLLNLELPILMTE